MTAVSGPPPLPSDESVTSAPSPPLVDVDVDVDVKGGEVVVEDGICESEDAPGSGAAVVNPLGSRRYTVSASKGRPI